MRSKEEVLRSKAALFTDLNVPRVTHKEPLGSIVEKVKDAPEHTALVVNEANKLMGLITDQDILKALSAPDLADKVKRNEATAEDVMTPLAPEESTVARSSDSLEDVIEILQGRNRLKRPLKVVPIVDASGSAVGQVSRDSIQKNLDELLEH
jgi:CBS-domain-containing membrane protein